VRKRIVSVRQQESRDCGVACLASIAAYHGRRVPLPTIHHLAAAGPGGVNALGLVQAATKLGLTAKGVRATLESLQTVGLPAIAHVRMGDRPHYVAVYDVTSRAIRYMDPQDGLTHSVRLSEFERIWSGVLVLLAPGDTFTLLDESVSPARRMWSLVAPHRMQMVQAFVGAGLSTILGLGSAIYIQKIVDLVLPTGNRNLLNLLSIVMLAIVALQLFIGVNQDLLLLGVARRIDGGLVSTYYEHLLHLPHRFFTGRRVGDIVSRVGDAVKVRAFVTTVVLGLAVNAVVLVASTSLLFMYSPRLALLVLVVLPPYAAVYFVVSRTNRSTQLGLIENAAALQSWLVESIEGIATIKHLRMEEAAIQETEMRLVRVLRAADRASRIGIGAGAVTQALARLAVVVVLWVGGGMVLRQQITPGELLSLYALMGFFTGPIGALIGMNGSLHGARIAADRLFDVMAIPREEDSAAPITLERDMVGDITFDDVSFRFGAGPLVFRHLNVTFRRGQFTAVVGESGSGKSTMLSLLHRREVPVDGRVRIGNYDITQLSSASVRSCIAVVPQKVELFSGTIVANIAAGDHEADVRRVMDLADRLGITDFVETLPEKFATLLGENGATLSGGQRQRIAIARALYQDPAVLVLDEATSALDTTSERRIQRVLQEIAATGDKTIVLIAHRLSTVCAADKIVVLKGGTVIEEGSHSELLAHEGAYRDLWREQYAVGDEAHPSDSTLDRRRPNAPSASGPAKARAGSET
jgi:ATP-binding cassette subfamily B protein